MRKRRPPKKRSSKRPPAQQVVVTIEAVTPSGDGQVGDLTIPFALHGEEVRIAQNQKRGVVLERFSDADLRQAPVCRHFGLPGDGCGGCTLQHWGEVASLERKKERLLMQLKQLDPGRSALDAVHISPPQARRRAKFTVSQAGVGFRRLHGREVVHLRECSVLHSDLLALVQPLASLAQDLRGDAAPSFDAQATRTETGIDLALDGVGEADLSLPSRERLSSFAETQDLARLTVDGVITAERRTPRLTFGGVPLALPSGVFLQATAEGEGALINEVREAARDARRVADLFCGAGTFSLPLSQGREVLAADIAGPAITALENASKAAGRQITAYRRDLFARPLQAAELQGLDAAVFDPPRAGALEQAKELAAAKIPTIIAVSCNPATLVRDAAAFTSDYTLFRAVLVDQFGWSPHIETVVVFRRRT